MVCHGVPPQKLLWEHLKSVTVGKKCSSLSFRDKRGFYIHAESADGSEYDKNGHRDWYYLGFLRHLFFRSSCYQCSYARPERIGDITIGDFWGLDRQSQAAGQMAQGVSLILPNTPKGQQFFERCRPAMIIEQRPVGEAISGNANLLRASAQHPRTRLFERNYQRQGFEPAARTALLPDYVRYLVLDVVSKMAPGGLRLLTSIIRKHRKSG